MKFSRQGAPEMVLRGSSGPISWPLWGLVATLLAGLLLGGHQRHGFAEFPLLLNYAYWVLRLGMAYLLFAGALALLELSPLAPRLACPARSDERRGGKGCVSTCKSLWVSFQ